MTFELITQIQKSRHGISRPQLIDGTYDNFIRGGIQWLTLCEFGSRRSCNSAIIATDRYDIPALFLIGGLKGLLEYIHHQDELEKFILQINRTPNIAVILKDGEFSFYTSILPSLNYTLFYSEDHFIDAIS